MPNRQLPFTMQHQLNSNWCWAANASSISIHYNHASPWTQCRVVCNCLGRQDCCGTQIPTACDIPYYLDEALTATHNLREYLSLPLLPRDIINEINHGWIVGARIGWRRGGGHFVSVFGYNDDGRDIYVYIADPIFGSRYIKLLDFANDYLNAGRWTHSYLITAPHNNMLEFTKIDESLLQKARNSAPKNLTVDDVNFGFITESLHSSEKTMPHDVFTIDFDSLKGTRYPTMISEGVRLIDENEKGQNFIFEFANPDKNAELKQIIFDDAYTTNYKKTLIQAKERLTDDKGTFKIGVVQQPELKVDAIWIREINAQKPKDFYIPLFSNGFLKAGQIYSDSEFVMLLRLKALNFKPDEDDRLGG